MLWLSFAQRGLKLRCDEEYYDEAKQDYPRIAYEEGKQAFVDENGRTQIPIREFAETLGFTVDWNEAEGKVTISRDGTKIAMHIGNPVLNINDAAMQMDTSPVIVNDLTYIPLRYAGEAFGYVIEYTEAEVVQSAG